jgi:hypothetical protein
MAPWLHDVSHIAPTAKFIAAPWAISTLYVASAYNFKIRHISSNVRHCALFTCVQWQLFAV